MPYQLIVLKGRSDARAIPIRDDGITTIGRQDDCQLRIASSQVSRKHGQLFEKEGYLLIKDQGSSNGIFVNGQKIEGQRVLEHGDKLLIGPVSFRVEKLAAPAAGAKPSDTAVGGAVVGTAVAAGAAGAVQDALVDDDEFEIDFGDEPEAPEPSPAAKPAAAVTAAEPTQTVPTSSAPVPAPAPPAKAEEAELADEAIAEFLFNLEVDDEDKK